MLNDKNILITGASGFVGASLAHALYKTNKVYLLIRKTSNLWRLNSIARNPNIIFLYGELENFESMESVADNFYDLVIHSATYGGYRFQQDDNKIVSTNLTGVINLLNTVQKTGYDTFINIGSSSEYGVKTAPMKESDLLEPLSTYGVTKAAATLYCRTTSKNSEKKIVTARLFSPFGIYDDKNRLISQLISSYILRKDFKINTPYAVRDYIYINDVIDAIVKIATFSDDFEFGEIVNIGSGKDIMIKNVNDVLKDIFGYSHVAFSSKENVLKKEDSTSVWKADISKMKKITGWEPACSFEKAMEETVNWQKKNIKYYN